MLGTMKFSITRHGNFLQSALLGFVLACAALPAQGAGFFVVQAKTELVERVYRLTAELRYELTPEVRDALINGIPIILSLDIEIQLPSAYYFWSETVATLKQRYQLQYHALSERFLVTNLNSGAQEYFPSLDEALAHLSKVADLPVLDAGLLAPDVQYTARLRTEIEFDRLPVPLRYYAYVLPSWRLSSEWYNWPL